MRDGLLRLRQPRGDGLAHAVERHFLGRHVAIEREDIGCGGTGCRRGRTGDTRFDIARDDAAMRPGTADARQIDTVLAGETARQRRHRDAARDPGRTEIALGGAHFAERAPAARQASCSEQGP